LVAQRIVFEKDLPDWHREIVYDPQTSGGLLVAIPGNQAPDLLNALKQNGITMARIIGEVTAQEGAAYLVFK